MSMSMLSVQVVGFALILVATVLDRLDRSSYPAPRAACLWFDFLCASLVTIDAVAARKWAFLLVGGVWTMVSLHGLVHWARGDTPVRTRSTTRRTTAPATATTATAATKEQA
jgi:hypothetical protein